MLTWPFADQENPGNSAHNLVSLLKASHQKKTQTKMQIGILKGRIPQDTGSVGSGVFISTLK